MLEVFGAIALGVSLYIGEKLWDERCARLERQRALAEMRRRRDQDRRDREREGR